jgi:hypothetical protein
MSRLPLLLLGVAASGCAFVRQIPAEHSPVSTARYYRSQDDANMAAGAAADLVLGALIRGPRRCGDVNHFCGTAAPVARVAIVGGLGLVRRQTDRGYREGGLLVDVWSAMATEILRVIWLGARGKFSRW